LTYLHRTQPEASVELVLNPTQIVVLKAKSPQLPTVLTVALALEAVARERWLFGTSPPNSYWYSGALAWLVEIAKPL